MLAIFSVRGNIEVTTRTHSKKILGTLQSRVYRKNKNDRSIIVNLGDTFSLISASKRQVKRALGDKIRLMLQSRIQM